MLRMLPMWAYGIAGAALLSFGAGWTMQGWRWSAADAERLKAEVDARDEQIERQDGIATEYERGRADGAVEARARETKIREIYRDVQVPTSCEPSPDALRVLDDALGKAGSATGEPRAAVRGTTAAS